jgi:hypothetical protein
LLTDLRERLEAELLQSYQRGFVNATKHRVKTARAADATEPKDTAAQS